MNPATSAKRVRDFDSALLDGLAAREYADVMSSATVRLFRKSTQITAQGYGARHLLLMRNGCARYFTRTPDGSKLPLSWVARGEPIGGMSIVLRQSSYMMSCEALRDTECFCWDRDVFRKYIAKYPRLTDNAILIAAGYVEWFLEAYTALCVQTARERLADTLLAYAHGIGTEGAEGVLVDVTNEDLAHSAHITKYTTCRLLAHWQKTRVISKLRGRILVRRPDLLESIVASGPSR